MCEDIYNAAEDYVVNRNWTVIPLTQKTKIPVNKGWQKARNSKVEIQRNRIFDIWFKKDNLNLGILCGKRNDIIVIDIDDDTFIDEVMQGVEKFETLTSWRHHDQKRHLFFKYDESFSKNKPNSTTHKIEVLSTGRYVVAPPSIHPDGATYEWKIEAPIIEMPTKFRENLDKLFARDAAFKKTARKCRPWLKLIFQKKNLPLIDWHGSEGRTKTLFVMSELKANGATDDTLLYTLKMMFKGDFNESDSETEIDNIKKDATGRADSIKDAFFTDIILKDNDFRKRRRESGKTEDWVNAERKIENMEFPGFINDYIEHAAWCTDAPKEYHYVCALNILSILAGRDLMISTRQTKIFPNLYISMLGNSTISRKSASVDVMEDVLDNVFVADHKLPNSFSPEAFVELMSKEEKRHIINDEAGSFLLNMKRSYMADMKEILNLFYDGKSYNRQLRSGKGKQSEFNVDAPYLNVFLATTPKNFMAGSEEIDVRSGWLARFIFCHPQYKRELRSINFDAEAKDGMVEDICRYALGIKEWLRNHDEMKVSRNAQEIYVNWCDSLEAILIESDDEIANALTGRMEINCLKIALIHAISRKTPIISPGDMDSAIDVCEKFFYPCGLSIMRDIEEQTRTDLVARIIDIVIRTLKRKGGEAKRRDLLNAANIKSKDFEDIIDTLIDGGRVREVRGEDHGKNTSIKYCLLIDAIDAID